MNRRRAIPSTCACGAAVLHGVDANVAGFTATADSRPLTRTGELLAVIQGRAVYDLDSRPSLHRRRAWHIRGNPPTPYRPVVAEHRCGQPLPDAWIAPTAPATPPRDTTEVPF